MGLALVAFGLGVSGVVVGTAGIALPGTSRPETSRSEETVTLVPAASSTCAATGPYLAPAQGSVGLPPGVGTCAGGPVTVTTPGTVLDGWDLRGGVVVAATDVVVRRSRITGDGTAAYGVVTRPGASVRIEDTTLTGRFEEAAIGGADWTAERVEIVGVSGDGAHAGPGARLRASVLSRFEPGADVDGLEVRGSDVVVEDSTVRMAPEHRSAVFIDPAGPGDAGPDGGPTVLRANVLGGGGYTVHQAAGRLDDVRIVDNRFGHDAALAPLRVEPTATTRDNTFVDGGPVSGL
jgi:hypothetical protein